MGEFELIERYFGLPAALAHEDRSDVALGIGDDAAVLAPPPGRQLVAALDTLVEGRHFPAGSPAASIGHRALAVNLSDLAAMGADPAWFLLALTLPEADAAFLEPFAASMLGLAAEHGAALVGGDTTRGPLSVSVQALGFVDAGASLRRSGGSPGDLLYVSGTPGDAAAGLRIAMRESPPAAGDAAGRQYLLDRFQFPMPRIGLGRALRRLASACIDVSDGLAADAGKLAASSACRAVLVVDQLPLSAQLRACCGDELAQQLALTGGDDYELCFAVPPSLAGGLEQQLEQAGCGIRCIGRLETGRGVQIIGGSNAALIDTAGYDHFPHR